MMGNGFRLLKSIYNKFKTSFSLNFVKKHL